MSNTISHSLLVTRSYFGGFSFPLDLNYFPLVLWLFHIIGRLPVKYRSGPGTRRFPNTVINIIFADPEALLRKCEIFRQISTLFLFIIYFFIRVIPTQIYRNVYVEETSTWSLESFVILTCEQQEVRTFCSELLSDVFFPHMYFGCFVKLTQLFLYVMRINLPEIRFINKIWYMVQNARKKFINLKGNFSFKKNEFNIHQHQLFQW